MEDKYLSEKESIELISHMLKKIKNNVNENGVGAILWGTVIAVCGLVSYAQMQFNFKLPFDIWLLTFIALVPQIILSIKEAKQRKIKSHIDDVIAWVWMTYAISISCLVFYCNIVPSVSQQFLAHQGKQLLLKTIANNIFEEYMPYVNSQGSLFLMLYAFPTLITGLSNKFKPMVIGAIICYILFFVSLFTIVKYDMLFNGMAAIACWLIPGIILRKKFLRQQKLQNSLV